MGALDPRDHDLFAPLEPAAWAEVEAAARTVRHPANATLFRRGDPATRFFFVQEGAVKLVRRSGDGQEKVIEVVRAGQTFAEAVMFMAGVYPVEAVTIGPCVLVGFDSAHFRGMLRSSPDACLALLARMARRVHTHLAAVDALALKSASERVIEYLLTEAGERPGFHLGFPKQVLASLLGMTPESLSRTLGGLQQRGFIAVRGSYIQILDPAALRDRLDL